MNLKTKLILKGIATFIPGMRKIPRKGSMGGSVSPRYCYSVWLRHLMMVWDKCGNEVPKIVAEIGPGESLGTGLAALLSGAKQYYGFDGVRLVNSDIELGIFDELIRLFRGKTEIPGPDEFPLIKPPVDSYKFPSHILSDEYLDDCLRTDRLDRIREALVGPSSNYESGSPIIYIAPDYDLKKIPDGTFDMIFSQTAMEYVPNLRESYRQLYNLLTPNGIMSHQIDLTSMGLSETWDGHWAYSDFEWKLIRGKKRCIINRATHSDHIKFMQNAGFRIIKDVPRASPPTFSRSYLAKTFKSHPADDLHITGTYVLAAK